MYMCMYIYACIQPTAEYGNGRQGVSAPRYQNVSEGEEPNLALNTSVPGSPMSGHNLDQSEAGVTPERFADWMLKTACCSCMQGPHHARHEKSH